MSSASSTILIYWAFAEASTKVSPLVFHTVDTIRELPLTKNELVILVGIALFAFGSYYKRDLIKNKIKKFKERRKFKEDKKEKPRKENIIKKLEKIDKKRKKTLTKEQKIELEKMKRELDKI